MALDPGGTLALLHATGAVLGHDQVAPPEFTTATDTNVELFGVGSLIVPALQLLGPRLVTTCVYVILAPAATGLGEPLFVTDRSQMSFTPVVTVVLLLERVGSDVVAVTEEFAVIVPMGTVEGTPTTTTMSAEVPDGRLAVSLQLTFPVEPTAGAVHVHPAGASTDWNVVFSGVASVKLTPVDAAGPLFVIVWVYVMLFQA